MLPKLEVMYLYGVQIGRAQVNVDKFLLTDIFLSTLQRSIWYLLKVNLILAFFSLYFLFIPNLFAEYLASYLAIKYTFVTFYKAHLTTLNTLCRKRIGFLFYNAFWR